MEIKVKNLVIHFNIPWKGPIVDAQYGDWKTQTCFWFFAIFLRIFERKRTLNGRGSRIVFRNYRRQYRLLTGQKMPLNARPT